MPDLLTLATPDWTLQVWSRDVETPRKQLQHTLVVRGNKPLPPSRIRLTPAEGASVNGQVFISGEMSLPAALFFENRQYDFEFTFQDGITDPLIHHRLKTIEDCFHLRGQLLRGNINAGNDIGWFRLGVSYQRGGKPVRQSLSFEVLPTKMDMTSDLQQILQTVDAQYPLWRFSLAQKTELELAQSRKPHEQFPLLWLSHFKALREELESSVKQVVNAPHSRLVPVTRSLTADRLKGHISHRLEEQVVEHINAGEYHHRYRVTARKLSTDTPENRFIKMVLERCVRMLSRIDLLARDNNKSPDQQPLSDSFFDELERWARPLEQYLARPFFWDVGDFNGMSRESLVLHQKAGYSGVYRVWQQLKLYLDTLGATSSISMKTVAELYEVWCLLEMRRMLIELGFEEKQSSKPRLADKDLVKILRDGMGAAFTLEREDIVIRLAHEPVFSSPEQVRKHGIYSWITSQKPDILLEARFRNGSVIRWVFDAKYRIATEDNASGNNPVDYAPDDAINQMHRYRDALIHLEKSSEGVESKSRPVLGAYVLYPGFFDEKNANIYNKAIDEIGIGAFPLLPGHTNAWLQNFLTEKFGNRPLAAGYSAPDPDRFYVEDSARIPYQKMSVNRYGNLVLLATAAPRAGRTQAYLDSFSNGTARWYHMKLHATERLSMQQSAISEVGYCAIAVSKPGSTDREIHFSYPVLSIALKRRGELSIDMTGSTGSIKNPDELYWLFELGIAKQLPAPVKKFGLQGHHVKITDISALFMATLWSELPDRYAFLFKA